MGIRGKNYRRSEIIFKVAARRQFPLSMRDKFGINSLDRVRFKQATAFFIQINRPITQPSIQSLSNPTSQPSRKPSP
jgi:hypothetical protein